MTTVAVFDELIRVLGAELERRYGERLVTFAVYGSVGRGTARPDSDLDVLAVVRGWGPRTQRSAEFSEIERALQPALDAAAQQGVTTFLSPLLKTPEEVEGGNLIYLDMVEDAKLFVDRDGFFAARLDRLRRRLAELGAKRVWRGTKWYWDLKPDYKHGDTIEL